MIIKKFQEGGATPTAPVQTPQGGEEQMMQQIAQMAQEIIQQIGPDAAAMLAQIIMEMLHGGQAPVGEPQEGEPVFKKGGKLCGRMKKKAKMNKGGKC